MQLEGVVEDDEAAALGGGKLPVFERLGDAGFGGGGPRELWVTVESWTEPVLPMSALVLHLPSAAQPDAQARVHQVASVFVDGEICFVFAASVVAAAPGKRDYRQGDQPDCCSFIYVHLSLLVCLDEQCSIFST